MIPGLATGHGGVNRFLLDHFSRGRDRHETTCIIGALICGDQAMTGERPEQLLDAREGLFGADTEVAEIVVLLSNRQADALIAAAQRWGLTAGQALRRLIEDFTGQGDSRPPREAG
jgi:hypothetical protein